MSELIISVIKVFVLYNWIQKLYVRKLLRQTVSIGIDIDTFFVIKNKLCLIQTATTTGISIAAPDQKIAFTRQRLLFKILIELLTV